MALSWGYGGLLMGPRSHDMMVLVPEDGRANGS